ncbi:Protein of unknown function [Cotesia congregata]|uniref:DUF4218 domain-containing protein n=1 Tax=Cotesia congregata TaxID=51543 RepID=A0A8J2E6V6_COTCN|nr:Protein of unknown function [Cotesia congregata]
MHCVGLGVCRQFAGLWFDSKNSNEEFYFGDRIDVVDNLITSFFPTSTFLRTPRKLSDRVHFKAHEWVAFLFVYSLPILKLVFPKKFVDHWALLVDGISILVKKSVMKSELVYAGQCLHEFITGVESLYGKKHVSFNVHLLAHLSESVKNWGPLPTHSAFIYEDFNQTIQEYVKSSNGVHIQICDSFRIKCCIDRLLIICQNHLNHKQKKYLDEMLNRKSRPSSKLLLGNVGVLGKPVILSQLLPYQLTAFQRSEIIVNKNGIFFIYKRGIINEKIITSTSYTREKKEQILMFN